ncbi:MULTISPECIES: hypothetical protein [unclassified Microcoleus]|nr:MULTISPECIES: hypothetical protein [unclassified Microcoleus]
MGDRPLNWIDDQHYSLGIASPVKVRSLAQTIRQVGRQVFIKK